MRTNASHPRKKQAGAKPEKIRRLAKFNSRAQLRLAHCNIEGLAKIYKLKEISKWAEYHNIDFMTLQETKIDVCKEMKEGNYTLFTSSGVDPKDADKLNNFRNKCQTTPASVWNNGAEKHGVAILLKNKFVDQIEVHPVNSRIMYLVLHMKPKVTLYSIYAPLSKNIKEHEKFFDDLSVHI